MTKIGVISDTHMRMPNERMFRLAERQFKDVSMVLHAGDLVSIRVLDAFIDKKVVAVCGNMCERDSTQVLSPKEVITVEGVRIGLIHGHGSRTGLEDRIFKEFDDVEAIVYGHTHSPANHLKQGVLMFNPGAFTSYSMGTETGTVGVLTVDEKGISGEILPL
ncbi:metallophosphoesterase family protein [Desulfatibacillum aliphaticivorans]|uniref:metallophosphoesterase family protein n=1 Tax=Desulfatibacillum aliphaticivorans TaxID=218208 RepID=UPI000416970F|nr:metallophosphoesterase family protein [Desulfatibacillum aliphaticivorans]